MLLQTKKKLQIFHFSAVLCTSAWFSCEFVSVNWTLFIICFIYCLLNFTLQFRIGTNKVFRTVCVIVVPSANQCCHDVIFLQLQSDQSYGNYSLKEPGCRTERPWVKMADFKSPLRWMWILMDSSLQVLYTSLKITDVFQHIQKWSSGVLMKLPFCFHFILRSLLMSLWSQVFCCFL